mmetsp:Transcript_6176/g.11695  ORF Transcript_6176/g.11695 Transcript_6176/m.11695 type:complete len:158 (-) Transcript_6176:88-561(-)
MTNTKTSFKKKVTWNNHLTALVIYVRDDVPLHISRSSVLLRRFLTKFEADAEQYVRGVMKRKGLEGIPAPSNKNAVSNRIQKQTSCIVKQKVKMKPQTHSPRRRQENPFRKKLQGKGSTAKKENINVSTNSTIGINVNKSNNKKQCTLDSFWRTKGK